MKKFKLVACAAAVAALASLSAQAAVNLDDGSGTVSTYASELVVAGTTALTGNTIDVTATVGFGVVINQTRFVRMTLTNGKFATAVANGDLTFGGVAAGNIQVVQGGAIGDSFVIYQIDADVAVAQTATVAFALGSGVGVTMTSATSPVQVAYALYEDAPSAAAGTASGRLNISNTAAQTVANVGTGLEFSTVQTTTTVDVSAANGAYTLFLAGGAGTSTTVAQIGTVTLGAKAGVLDPGTGVDVLYTALVAAGTKLVVAADDLAAAVDPATVSTGLFLSAGANCGIAGTAGTARTATTVEFVTNTTALAGNALCFTVPGGNTTAIPTQSFTAAADLTAAAGSTAADFGATAAGQFERNGTVLKAAFAETPNGSYSGTVNLANTSSSAAAFTTSCLTTTGRVAGNAGSVAANSASRFGIGSAAGLGCPSNTRGVELTFAVPTGNVIGSVVRQDASTGQAAFDGMVGNQ